MTIPYISAEEILKRYEIILLDAYGVLVNAGGAIEGAREFIEHLHKLKKEYFVISNGCYCSPEESRLSYHSKGVPVARGRVITAAAVMADVLSQKKSPLKIKLLGAPYTKNYLQTQASITWSHGGGDDFDMVIIGDQQQLDFPRELDELITQISHKVKAGEDVDIYLPNPDIVYPQKAHHYGLTSGALGVVVESALKVLLGDEKAPKIIPLGKPHAPIFNKAFKDITHTLGTVNKESMVMLGDQLHTDIQGARWQGLDSVLMETGITPTSSPGFPPQNPDLKPHYLAQSLGLSS